METDQPRTTGNCEQLQYNFYFFMIDICPISLKHSLEVYIILPPEKVKAILLEQTVYPIP